jgi:aryl-alcohol dehydrogenase-like predicted oxidoreductase
MPDATGDAGRALSRMIDLALEAGVTTIDTADVYSAERPRKRSVGRSTGGASASSYASA